MTLLGRYLLLYIIGADLGTSVNLKIKGLRKGDTTNKQEPHIKEILF